MNMTDEYGVTGLRETDGDLMAEVVNYQPRSADGFGTPVESALIELFHEPSGRIVTVQALKRHTYRDSGDDMHGWVNNVSIRECPTGTWFRFGDGGSSLRDYTTKRDVNWGDVLRDVLDAAHYVIPEIR